MTIMVEGTGSLPDQQDLSASDSTDEVLPGQNSDAGDNNGDDDNSASSSDAAGGDEAANKDERRTLLDAVKDAVKESQGEDGASSALAKKDAAATDGQGATPDGNAKPADAATDATLPFHNHPRWKEVIAERDSYKGDAEQYRSITGYMDEHGLEPTEMAEGMFVMGLIKTNPEEALTRLETHTARLREFLGKGLPADLQKQVDEGLVTDEIARETARLRRVNEASTQQHERDETVRANNARVEAAQSMKSAVDTWEVDMRGRDPDFAKKTALVTTQVQLMIARQGVPKTPQQAVEYAKAAYQAVTKQLTGIVPARQPTPKVPAGGRNSHNAAAVPRTLAEAVRLGASQNA